MREKKRNFLWFSEHLTSLGRDSFSTTTAYLSRGRSRKERSESRVKRTRLLNKRRAQVRSAVRDGEKETVNPDFKNKYLLLNCQIYTTINILKKL